MNDNFPERKNKNMEKRTEKRKVGILLFDEVEVLDFAGPFEVFSITESEDHEKLFAVTTFAQEKKLIKARNGLEVMPRHDFENIPKMDILLIPGGYGAENIEIHNIELIEWIRRQAVHTPIIASVCTGAFLLAEAGLLCGKTAVTHWMDSERLQKDYPKINVINNMKFYDEETVITSAGISSGIDMCLYLIKKLCGESVAAATAKRMEYRTEVL